MRLDIVVDDELMELALELTGARSNREVVEQGLAALVRPKRQERLRAFRGRLRWEGDLDAMRRDA